MQLKILIYAVVGALGIYFVDSTGFTTDVWVMRPAFLTTSTYEDKLISQLPWYITATVWNGTGKRLSTDNQSLSSAYYSGMVNFIYSFQDFYVRLDTAVGNTAEDDVGGGRTAYTQWDDLLLSAGYQYRVSERCNTIYSALLGIPLHKDYGLVFIQEFGTGHAAAGLQGDIFYTFGENALIGCIRFVHTFSTTAPVTIAGVNASVDFDLGSWFDFILSYKRTFKEKHMLEIAYNPTPVFGIRACPSLGDTIPSYVVRNSWYTDYTYTITRHHPMSINVSFLYAFDHAPNNDISHSALQRVLSYSLTWSINF